MTPEQISMTSVLVDGPEADRRVFPVRAAYLASSDWPCGASLLAHSGGGPYILVLSGLSAISLNVFGAWTLLLGLAREDRRSSRFGDLRARLS